MKILLPSRKRGVLHAIQLSRPFSSNKTSIPFRSNRIHKALKILQLVNLKTNVPSNNSQSHLRLIQDFLQTGSKQQAINVNSIPSGSSNHPQTREMIENMPEPDAPETKHLLFDAVVLSQRVSLCGYVRNLLGGVQYHSVAIKTGCLANAYVGSSLITMYSKCGEIENADKVFAEMSVKNVVSWTAVIAGFSQDWRIDDCLKLYHIMRDSETKPNDYTFTGLLSACMGTGALGQGTSVHCQVILMGFISYIHVANSLVSMYCKCGKVDDGLHLFRKSPKKDVVSWNSMIAGFAQYGLALRAIDLFEEMKMRKVKPDAITFLGILSSCRHAGLVDEGRRYFNSMFGYGIEPELDHYSCIVDLLGRSGKLQEARDFIKKMPIRPNAVIWGSLLFSCRLHGSVLIGIEAAESRLELEPQCAATHVLLANLYASFGYWQQAARIRKLMKDKGLRTSPGYSWIEISNKVYRFKAEDRLNTQVAQIIDVLDHLMDHMRNFCYVHEVYVEEGDDIFQVTPLVM